MNGVGDVSVGDIVGFYTIVLVKRGVDWETIKAKKGIGLWVLITLDNWVFANISCFGCEAVKVFPRVV